MRVYVYVYTAEALGLPLIPPYFGHDKSFRKGANFAVGGATTLDLSFFQSRGILSSNAAPLNISLDTQLGWFQQLKPTLCNSTKGCDHLVSSAASLFRKAIIKLIKIEKN